MSVQSTLLDELNSAFYNRQHTSEGSTDSESIKSEGTAALYLKIMAFSSAFMIYKMLISMPEVSDIL